MEEIINQEEIVVLTQTEKATKALVKATADLAKAADLSVYLETVEKINEDVAVQSNKLIQLEKTYTTKTVELEKTYADKFTNLDVDYDNKVRAKIIDFKLKIQENENKELSQLLTKRNLVSIDSNELDILKSDSIYNEEKAEDAVNAAVNAAEKALHASYNGKIAGINADHKVAVAETDAKVTSLENEIKFLRTSLVQAQDNLEATREAQIKMSENARQPVINVSGK